MRTTHLSSLLCLIALIVALPARGDARPADDTDTVTVVDDAAQAEPVAAPPPPSAEAGCTPCRAGEAPASASAPVFWRAALATSAVVALSGSAFAFYSQARMRSEADGIVVDHSISWPSPSIGLSSSDCGKSDAELAAHGSFDRGRFDRACSWRDRSLLGFAVAGVGMAGAVVSLVMVVREGRESDAAAARGAPSRHPVAIAPVVTPTSGGASLSVAW